MYGMGEEMERGYFEGRGSEGVKNEVSEHDRCKGIW
jgi:hypothetical protein